MPDGIFWIPLALILFFVMRGRRWSRYGPRSGLDRGEREQVAELQALVEEQRQHIESLEARVARVEDGLEFTERVLAEQAQGRLPVRPVTPEP